MLFFLFPIGFGGWLSFVDWNGISEPVWIGFENFIRLAGDSVFIAALGNTGFYIALSLGLVVPLALALSVLVDQRWLRGRSVFQAALFIPAVVAPAVAAVMFSIVFARQGILNGIVTGLFGVPPMGWLTDATWAPWAVGIVVLWRWTGFTMIYFLAGLRGIPEEIVESAEVDGASAWQVFRSITLPLLRPITAFVVIVVLHGASQIFDEPRILMRWPDATGPEDSVVSVAMFVETQAFQRGNFGYAAAASLVVFVVVVSVAFFLARRYRDPIE